MTDTVSKKRLMSFKEFCRDTNRTPSYAKKLQEILKLQDAEEKNKK